MVCEGAVGRGKTKRKRLDTVIGRGMNPGTNEEDRGLFLPLNETDGARQAGPDVEEMSAQK